MEEFEPWIKVEEVRASKRPERTLKRFFLRIFAHRAWDLPYFVTFIIWSLARAGGQFAEGSGPYVRMLLLLVSASALFPIFFALFFRCRYPLMLNRIPKDEVRFWVSH